MSLQKGVAVVAVVCLSMGAGVGFERARQTWKAPFVAAEMAALPERPPSVPSAIETVVVTNDAAARAENDALRRRLAELDQALAARGPNNAPSAAGAAASSTNDRPRRGSFTARMEQLKTTDPDRYAELQKQREEFRQTLAQREQDRQEFLAAVDVRNMTEEQRANHEKLLETAALIDALRAQMEQAQDGAARDQVRAQMGEAVAALGELYGAERQYLLEQTARSVGYEGSQVYDFVDQMQTLIDNTTLPNFRRRGAQR
jgi:hypothetical protein